MVLVTVHAGCPLTHLSPSTPDWKVVEADAACILVIFILVMDDITSAATI